MLKLYEKYCKLHKELHGYNAMDTCENKKDYHLLNTYDNTQSCFYLYDKDDPSKQTVLCRDCSLIEGIEKNKLDTCEELSKRTFVTKHAFKHKKLYGDKIFLAHEFELECCLTSIRFENSSREYGHDHCSCCNSKPTIDNPIIYFEYSTYFTEICSNCLRDSDHQFLYEVYLSKKDKKW